MLYLCFHRSENGLRVTYGVIFDSLFAGLLLSSIFGILLLEIGTFSVGKLTTVLFVFSAVAGGLFLRKMPAASLALRPDKYKLMLVLVLLLACLLRFPPSNWVTGGQDQGVYVNIGNNISRTGKIFIQDELLLEVSENDKVKEYYLEHTYMSVRKRVAPKYAGKKEGNYTPGFYVKDLSQAMIVPQFYHLHPMWFAISNSLLGVENTTFSLFVFSLVSIVLIYRLTGLVLGSPEAALIGAVVLATNPLHVYMSRYPVTEVTAAMFMLAGFYYLLRATGSEKGLAFCCLMSVLSFGCLFFTRISGFIYIPAFAFLIFHFRANLDNRSQVSATTYAIVGTLIFYVYSFIHGYEFSFPYAYEIYRHTLKFKLPSSTPLILGSIVAISIFALAYLAGKYRNVIRSLELRLEGRKKYVTIGIIGLTLLIIACKGYIFAFTDTIPDRRWKIAGSGFEALRHYNLIVLARIMTPVAFLLSLHGMYRLLQRWFFSHRHFAIGVLSLYFLVVYTYLKFMTPYLYYYARYLLSEVVPLLVICLAASLIYIKQKNRKAFIVLLLLILIPAIEKSFDARDIETNTTYETLKSIDSEFSENAIVFLDRKIIPLPMHILAPLRFTFNEKVFMFRKEDLLGGELDNIFGFFLEKGHALYIVSNDSDLENRHFSLVKTMPITSGFNLHQELKASIYKHTAAAMELIDGGT